MTKRFAESGAPLAVGIHFDMGPSATRPAPASDARRMSRRDTECGSRMPWIRCWDMAVSSSCLSRVIRRVLRELVDEAAHPLVELRLAGAVERRCRDIAQAVARGVEVLDEIGAVLRGELDVHDL